MPTPDLRFTPIPPREFEDENLADLHDALRRSDEAWRGARAFRLGDDLVRSLAVAHIEINHQFQRARWGRVRAPIRLPDLLR